VPRVPATWALDDWPARIVRTGLRRLPLFCNVVRPKSGHLSRWGHRSLGSGPPRPAPPPFPSEAGRRSATDTPDRRVPAPTAFRSPEPLQAGALAAQPSMVAAGSSETPGTGPASTSPSSDQKLRQVELAAYLDVPGIGQRFHHRQGRSHVANRRVRAGVSAVASVAAELALTTGTNGTRTCWTLAGSLDP
jgi:hypothetical protein